MPTANLYYRNPEHEPQIADAMKPLKGFIAEQLTCGSIALSPEEVSIRALRCALGDGMTADIEMDVTAAPLRERVERQDEIAGNIQAFVRERVPAASVNVWLMLCELGFSFKDPQ